MAKENISKIKKEPTIWENIFPKDTSDKGLFSKIHNELTQLHTRKTSNPIKKCGSKSCATFTQWNTMQQKQRRNYYLS